MDRISVSTTANPDGTYAARWEWWQNVNLHAEGLALPKTTGNITVSLAPRWVDNRAIMAEISAIHHLLCVEQIQGKSRLGIGIEIEVSFEEICKALNKESLKKTGRGLTDTVNVALFTKFLATKYFEANIKLHGSREFVELEPENTKDFNLTIQHVPSVELWSPVGSVSISRHALNRVVQRRMAKDEISFDTDLAAIPDAKWSRAWKWLQRVLPDSTEVAIPLDQLQLITSKYGEGVTALRHIGSQSVFILKRAGHGLEMVTITNDIHSNKLTAAYKLPMLVGQRIVEPGMR